MKISVNIKVKNPDYSRKKNFIPKEDREVWDIKTPKYIRHTPFDYKFEVKNYLINRNTNYDLNIIIVNNEIKHTVSLDNVTVIEFIGEIEKSYVVVSNEIIHQFVSKPGKRGCLCFNFDIKENAERLEDNIWVSEDNMKKIKEQFGNIKGFTDIDPNLRQGINSIILPTRHQPWEDFEDIPNRPALKWVLKPVTELNVSIRVLNVFEEAEIENIAELQQYPKERLLRFRNFGNQSLQEVEQAMAEIGIPY